MTSQLLNIPEQELVKSQVSRIVDYFLKSEGKIKPNFMVTGPSGSGKTALTRAIAEEADMGFLCINAAQLTKEGTSGASLSKVLSPLLNMGNSPVFVQIDEFDKLFISGNSNGDLAHETTNGVQNEMLTMLESGEVQVFGEWGKYQQVKTHNIIFAFTGAFNGEEDLTVSRLRAMGIKTEFLGRVPLLFTTLKPALDTLVRALKESTLLDEYVKHSEITKKSAVAKLTKCIKDNYTANTLGLRMVDSLIHIYFINKGVLTDAEIYSTLK